MFALLPLSCSNERQGLLLQTLSAPPPNKQFSAAPTRVTSASAVGGGKGAAAAAATAAAPLGIEQLLINPLVGRKVETWYPDHGGWYPGIITDYNITNDKHWCESHRKNRAVNNVLQVQG